MGAEGRWAYRDGWLWQCEPRAGSEGRSRASLFYVVGYGGRTDFGGMSHSQDTDRQQQDTQGADSDGGSGRPLSYAKVASKHLQPSSGQTSTDRSATGTPITAKVAAEVADSAELLHEEVPEREKDEAGVDKQTERRMSEEAETAAEVADSAQALDGRQVRSSRPPHPQLHTTI